MRRREVVGLLGGIAATSLAWRPGLSAGQAAPVVGLLSGGSLAPWAQAVAALLRSLSEAGFVDAKTVAIEYRWAEADYRRLPELAADLVNRRPAPNEAQIRSRLIPACGPQT